MDLDAFRNMAATERTHWWFVGRRSIIRSLIEGRVRPRAGSKVLEVGCGTGGNLELLAQYGNLEAFEKDDVARALARERTTVDVQPGYLPDGIERIQGPYEMIALFDVLEHIEQDEVSLRTLSSLLAPDGKIILTVPALQFLWSDHDVRHHHHRRYSRRQLRDVIERAGLKVDYISYFNSALLPLAVVQRLARRFLSCETRGDAEPSQMLNRILRHIFESERAVLARISLPLGLSLCAICSIK